MVFRDKQKIVEWLLRVALAFAFLYVAVASFRDPFSWIGFFPQFLRDLVPAQTLLTGFSIFEIVLGLWLLSGKWLKFASLLAAATLAGIVLFNWGARDIVFRDVSLALAALALTALSYSK